MFKKIWFQIHWCVGITAGTLLMVVGVTGALLSFEDEMLAALNPGIISVTPSSSALASAPQILQAVERQQPGRPVVMLTVQEAKDKAAQIMFAPPAGQRRGEMRYVNPYDGQILPPVRFKAVFAFIERLHRWFLLPVENGKLLAGWVASGMLVLALSGLYLRWPRRIFSWRSWFKIDFRLKGRPFLWTLHSVTGTWVLIVYLISGLTGVYWSFNWVRTAVDDAAGLPRREAPNLAAQRKLPPDAGSNPAAEKQRNHHKRDRDQTGEGSQAFQPDLTLAWRSFTARVPHYDRVILRLGRDPGAAVSVFYTDPSPPHERAFNTLQIDPASGLISKQSLFAQRSGLSYIVANIYALHTGSFFGLPGRIIMTLAAASMPLFGITGWLLYLRRRRTKRQNRAQRALTGSSPQPSSGTQRVRVIHASQTGHAETLALETATMLRAAGIHAIVHPLSRLDPDELTASVQSASEWLLFVVSTFGDGEAPDLARGFVSRSMRAVGQLPPTSRYAVLALGDRHYTHFCGFGHTVDEWMKSGGAEPLFPLIELDGDDPAAAERWMSSVLDLFGMTPDSAVRTRATARPSHMPVYTRWKLVEREWLNPGSPGKPLFKIRLEPLDAGLSMWHSGALADILPLNGPAKVQAVLTQTGFSPGAGVMWQNHPCTLELALSHADLSNGVPSLATPAELVAALKPLAVRTYSIASTGLSGAIELLVRQSWQGDVLGVASGWLTEYAPEGATISLLVRDNPQFELVPDGTPCIFIGNGSGLAGLMSHLRTRSMNGQGQNWLIYGERTAAADTHYAEEIDRMLEQQDLTYLDRAFSRDAGAPDSPPGTLRYVQDCLLEQKDAVREWLAHNATVYVCGSLKGMGEAVDAALADIVGALALEAMLEQGRYRRDVY